MNAPAVSIKVANRFHELRRRYLAVRLGIVMAIAVAALIAVWMMLTACDYFWEWPASYRQIAALIGGAAILVWLMGRFFVISRDTRQRKFASAIEDSFTDFGQRIRTVLETVDGRVSGPQEMLAALGHQTLGRWETLTPAQIIPKRMLLGCGVVALAGVLLTASLLASGGDLRIAMLRALGTDIPYTNLKVTPGDTRLLEGAPIEVSLELTGRTNRDVVLRYRIVPDDANAGDIDPPHDSLTEKSPTDSFHDNWIESELVSIESEFAAENLTPNDRQALFAAALGKAKNPVEYQFMTSVGNTRVYRVDVQPLIEAERIETHVEPPAYTQLESRTFATASVSVLERSLVNVTIETNYPLRQATLEIGNKPSELQGVKIDPGDDASHWTFLLPSRESIHWRFSGSGNDGTPMLPVKGRLRVRSDRAPAVTWRDPPEELRVHTLAELPLRVQLSDDYGISEAGVVFQLGDDEYVLTDWIAEQNAANRTRVPLEEILPLESFQLTERDFISYYAYAVDNREWGAQRSESDVRYIDIRPLRQFYSEIEIEPSDGGAGVLVQLGEIIRRQRFLINRTRRLLTSSRVELAKQLGTIDRMVENQSELAGLTRFLAEFFARRGSDDVEALNQAEAAMLQAADSLAAGSFDLAMVQEQEALRALAEARRSLEILLIKNPIPRQSLCKLCNQLRQKLRREKPKTQRIIADTLKRIATQQMQLASSACSICQQMGQSGTSQRGTRQNNQGQAGNNGAGIMPNQNTGDGANKEGKNTEQSASDENDRQVAESKQNDSEKDANGSDEMNNEGAQDNESDDGDKSDQPSLEEQRAELYAKQIELLERLRGLEDQLADRLGRSSLLAKRMQGTKAAMDNLATQARDGKLDQFEGGSGDAAEQLREMGLQLEALASDEPVSRVSSIRDMTSALANMESELAARMDRNLSAAASANRNAGSNESSTSRSAKRMQRRAETIEDVLKAPAQVGDVETSEVNDYLQQFVQATEFLRQLEETREAAEAILGQSENAQRADDEPADNVGQGHTDSSEDNDEATAGLDRAKEYAEEARMLDELYRRLVAPRLARLRAMEQKANQLAQRLGQGKQSEQSEQDPETQAGIRQLQRELDEEGLGGLAEMLDETKLTEDEGAGTDSEMRDAGIGGASRSSLGVRRNHPQWSGLALISSELQKRIQEMILLEISADRDVPVPPQYRRAVDRYFRVLAGESKTDAASPGAVGTMIEPSGGNP